MWGRVKTVVLAAVVGVAALVPLFGDPRQTPVTHPLWARMLLRALEMTDAVKASAQASQVFSTLAWRDSLSYPADRYLRAQGAVLREEGGQPVLAAGEGPAEVVYAVAVARPGDYQLRARLAGPPVPATAEVVPLSGGDALESFSLVPSPEGGWVFAGSAHLDPGAYAAQFLLPAGHTLAQVEIAPPCVNPIEPAGGWRPEATTTNEDLAITAVRAIDVEHELPPAASPIEMNGESFQVEAPAEAVEERTRATGLERASLRAGRSGLRAVVSFDLPEPGLYSLTALVSPGSGQRWTMDGCRKAIVCPATGTGWRPILSQEFQAGRHTLVVTLGDGASLEQMRLELKKSAPADYVATLKRLGFDAGPAGPVTRARALEAMGFVREQRRALLAELCGDRVPFEETPTALPTQTAGTSPPTGPGEGGGGQPPGPVDPPIGPPILPPQPPGSPTQPVGSGL